MLEHTCPRIIILQRSRHVLLPKNGLIARSTRCVCGIRDHVVYHFLFQGDTLVVVGKELSMLVRLARSEFLHDFGLVRESLEELHQSEGNETYPDDFRVPGC